MGARLSSVCVQCQWAFVALHVPWSASQPPAAAQPLGWALPHIADAGSLRTACQYSASLGGFWLSQKLLYHEIQETNPDTAMAWWYQGMQSEQLEAPPHDLWCS